MRLSIEGIQAAQSANERMIAAVRPDGAIGRAVKYGVTEAYRHMQRVTHVDTGALRASERMGLSGVRGRIFIDPASVNPHGQRPSRYGPIEHARGGGHAFMLRTVDEAGEGILREMANIVKGAL